MREHIKWIDSLKGFAMLCVVLGHVADGYLGGLELSPSEFVLLGGVFNLIYSFHMPLFMFISGFLFHYAYFDKVSGAYKKDRLKKQCLNMAGVYVFFSVVLGCFKMVFSGSVNKPVTIIDILMIWCRPIALYWYLYVLIVLYCFFSWTAVYKRKENTILLLTATMSALSIVIIENAFEIHRFLYYALFFFVGILYCGNKQYPLFSKSSVLGMLMLSLLCMVLFWEDGRTLNTIPAINCVTALGITLGLVMLFESVKMLENCAVFQIIGKNCLEVYVTHCFLTAGFRVVLPKVGIQNVIISMVLNCFLSTVLPLVAVTLMRRWGLYNIFFKPYTYLTKRTTTNKITM